jgi:histidine triad (HIT) family protein
MPSIFSRIIAGEIPCYKVAETDQFLAFLDIRPVMKGHTLCIPKQEVDEIFDLEDNLLAELSIFAKKVAQGVKAVVPCKRVGVMVIGLEVPHAHIHLVPINTEADFFNRKSVLLSAEEMQNLASEIAAATHL